MLSVIDNMLHQQVTVTLCLLNGYYLYCNYSVFVSDDKQMIVLDLVSVSSFTFMG